MNVIKTVDHYFTPNVRYKIASRGRLFEHEPIMKGSEQYERSTSANTVCRLSRVRDATREEASSTRDAQNTNRHSRLTPFAHPPVQQQRRHFDPLLYLPGGFPGHKP
jgi:hypothetical protein